MKRRNENGFETWGGYMNAKISKLEAQFDDEKNNVFKLKNRISDIFQGVSIFVNGYTEPSADELRCLMLLHGGTYHHYFRKEKTTHIIAESLPNAKYDQMKTLKIVLPRWIIESIEAGKLLNYNNYLLQNEFPQAVQFQQGDFSTKYNATKGKDLKVSKTAADSGYLKEFYDNSRLHYISTLARMLKQHVSELREKHTGSFLGRKLLLENLDLKSTSSQNSLDENIVMHIDMDCFFVAVALRKYPHLKGQPIAVAHAKTKTGSNQEKANINFEINFYKNKMKSKIKDKTNIDVKKIIDDKNKEKDNNSINNNRVSDDDNDDDDIEKWSKEISSMSEIASCSYEARKFGVSKGMYLGTALKFCPDLKTIPYDFEGYKQVSELFYNTIADYTLDIEAVSCDELYIDCNSLLSEIKITPWKLAEILRSEIQRKTNCTASIGIGKNKLQAKLATNHAKPNGQFYLTPEELSDFMKNLSVYDIPGVGRTIGAQLKNLQIKTCQDLQNISLASLKKEFGVKIGETLYNYCRGIDKKPVNYNNERKSVSAEVNYGIRFNDDEEAEIFLKQLSEEVSNRLKDLKVMGKNITLKIMFRAKNAPLETAKYLGHGACDSISRSISLTFTTNDAIIIFKNVSRLYHLLNIPASDLRGIGIQITKLESVKRSLKTLSAYFDQNYSNKNFDADKTKPKNLQIAIEKTKSTSSVFKTDVLSKTKEEKYSDLSLKNSCAERSVEHIKNTKNEEVNKNARNIVQTFPSENFGNAVDEIDQLLKLNFKEIKLMIKEWVAAEKCPEPFDVTLLKTYFKRLIQKKNLEKLCVLLRCLHRYIKTERENYVLWQMTYDDIVDTIQSSMVTVFGRTLADEVI